MSTSRFFPSVIAHRGASAYAPENTIAAFKKANDLNQKWVEFDVVVSPADPNHIPFIFHDETIDRTTNGKGELKDFTYNELRQLDAGAWFGQEFIGERIPSLKEVIEFIAKNDMTANVEIKPLKGEEERTVVEALNVITNIFPQPDSHIIFSSFSIKALDYLREYSPTCYLSLLLNQWTPGWENICESLNCISVNVDEKILTAEKATQIKKMGKHLLCYTVDKPERATELYAMGVEAVFSNAPDKIQPGLPSQSITLR